MIQFSKGDMFAGQYDILVNTVNCVGAMGKGIALEFKRRWPEMYDAYKEKCQNGEIQPGKLMIWHPPFENAGNLQTIVNFPTKRHWRDGSLYEDVDLGLISLCDYLRPLGNVKVALPPLGCGNGGLDWTKVSSMITEKLSNLDAIITVFEPIIITSTKIVSAETVDKQVKSTVKQKKRPSDFEIIRTILQRSHERKLPFILKNMGEDSDILFLCSEEEQKGSGATKKIGFKFGSPDTAIGLFEWTSDEVKAAADAVLPKIVGMNESGDIPTIVNIREQFSLLAKTKGESIDIPLHNNGQGTWWYNRQGESDEDRTVYVSKGIDSLFHMRMIKAWCDRYRHLLSTDNPDYLYYSYTHPEGGTGEILTLTPPDPDHPMGVLYPHGFRSMVTRGKDVILDKFLLDLPFPVVKQDLIVFTLDGSTTQIAHRLVADGWRMILLRPHAVIFPTASTPIPDKGSHLL